jgi:phenylalanine-4-hydroxylase
LERGGENLVKCCEELKSHCLNVQFFDTHGEVQWFPRKPSDFDELSKRAIDYGDNLAPDHPGYHDAEYRQRRRQSGLLALQYRHKTEIPRVQCTEKEVATWREVFRNLKRL